MKRHYWRCYISIALCGLLAMSAAIANTGDATLRYEFTKANGEAYQKIFALRFKEATSQLNAIKKQEPTNLMPYFLENYIDFLKITINENEAEFNTLKLNKDRRLAKLKTGDPRSPYYRYCQAEVYLQWALARLKFEQYFTAFGEIKKAYALLEENQKLHPQFIANKKTLGLLHALIGTIPDEYQWGVKLLGGMEGSIAQGKKEIAAVLAYAKKENFPFEEETVVMYAFLLLHLGNESDEAWAVLQQHTKLDPSQSPLACFVYANIAARIGRNDEAIRLLEQRPKGVAYQPFYFLDYQLGLYKLNRLDKDAATHIQLYIQKFRGVNYIKEAYQRLAWHALLQGKPAEYKRYMNLCVTRGKAISSSDKTALREAQKNTPPLLTLLKARLLFDGGYYARAYEVLQAQEGQSRSKTDVLEYHYRMGRICHQWGKTPAAIEHYELALSKGKQDPSYFACSAALYLGQIYEKANNAAKAKAYYKTCLQLNPAEYADGLHQKAKAGLNRLK